MNGIRFVHADKFRLAGSISGLAAAPDWLRRLARDATRTAAQRVIETTAAVNADFLFIGGSCTDSEDYRSSVAEWLRGPLDQLRRRGIPVVMVSAQPDETSALADVVVHPGERLLASRVGGRVQLSLAGTAPSGGAELVVSPALAGPAAEAAVNYLWEAGPRRSRRSQRDGHVVHSAGATQSLGPEETGEFGCLVAETDPVSKRLQTEFTATDVLRFETREIKAGAGQARQELCNGIVDETRSLARQQAYTTVVDWNVMLSPDTPADLRDYFHDNMLDAVRAVLRTGHLGVWPRQITLCPPTELTPSRLTSTAVDDLESVLFSTQLQNTERSPTLFAELVTAARLVARAA